MLQKYTLQWIDLTYALVLTVCLWMPLIITDFPTGSKQWPRDSCQLCSLPVGKSVIIRGIPRHTMNTKTQVGSIHYGVYLCNIILQTNGVNFVPCLKLSISHRQPL